LKKELHEAAIKLCDERRTTIAHVADDGNVPGRRAIRREDVVVTLTRDGYIKRTPASTYRSQGRGGRGLLGQRTKAEDIVHHVIHTNTHDTLLCFTDRGVVHSLRVFKIPAYDRVAKACRWSTC